MTVFATRGYKQAAFIVAVCLSLLLAGFAQASSVKGGEVAPDFTLKTLHGPNLRLEEYRGQVVLINFWASWCGPCRQEMPILDRLHQRYEDTGFAVLGVNVEGEVAPAKKIVEEGKKIRLPPSTTRRSTPCASSSAPDGWCCPPAAAPVWCTR